MSRYHEYLRSDRWRAVREGALERAGHRCQVCNGGDRLQVHHRTYVNLGAERPEDITVLCDDCHELYHFQADGPLVEEVEEIIEGLAMGALLHQPGWPAHFNDLVFRIKNRSRREGLLSRYVKALDLAIQIDAAGKDA